jgi:hypothetical protein
MINFIKLLFFFKKFYFIFYFGKVLIPKATNVTAAPSYLP